MSLEPPQTNRRRIYLLRHGEVDYFDEHGQPLRANTVDLNNRGRADARAAADALSDIHFDLAVCTPFPRTRQTAQIVLGLRDLPLREVHALHELQGGQPQFPTVEQWERSIAYGFEGAHEEGACMAAGERFCDFEARVVPAWESLLLEPGWRTALLVAHGGVNRLLLAWACGAGLAGISAFEQDAGCINIIDVDVEDGTILRRLIRAVNLTPDNLMKRGVHLTNMEEVFVPVRRLLEGQGL